MNKKFLRILSVILSVMMIFGCVITVSAADDTPSTTERVNVKVRVEGITKNLAVKTVRAGKSSTVKAIIDAAGIDVVYEADSLVIKSVMDESTVTSSTWQYAVDGVIKTDAIDTVKIEQNSEIVLFNAASNAVIPTIGADEVALSGVIAFTGTDKNGAQAPISGATVTWETKTGEKTFTTDESGKIYLAESDITAGKHDVSIIKLNEYNVPTVVRMEKGTEIDISEYKGTVEEEKSIFEQVYDFLYTIFKGVVEVWIFYIREIGTLLGIIK